jgi:hypothetical protein
MLAKVLWCAALLAACAGAAAGGLQMPAQVGTAAGMEATSLARQRLTAALVEGPLEFDAAQCWSWRESGPGGTVQGLLLAGDVRIRVASQEFLARRAAVWLAPLPECDLQAAGDVWQVFVYMEDGHSVGGPIAVSGARVPVQAVIRVTSAGQGRAEEQAGGHEGVQMRAELHEQGRPRDAFVQEAERALAERLERGRGSSGVLAGPAQGEQQAPGAAARPAPAPGQPVFAELGIVTLFAPGRAEVGPADDEQALVLTGGVRVQYWERQRNAMLHLSAQRAVVFLEPGTGMEALQLDPQRIQGIYLEGDVVASDGQYTVRAPRAFYNLQQNRAILLDPVFWTYDQRLGMPLYLRARVLRQESLDQFHAESVMLTNTAFFDPDLAIGASSITLHRIPGLDGVRNYLRARNITLRAGGLPFFYLPAVRGDPEDIPLKALGVDTSRGGGTTLRSIWNIFGILGLDPPPGHRATLLVDWYFDRGLGAGANYQWRTPDATGGVFAYGLPDDKGRDFLVSGERRDPPRDTRGIVRVEHLERVSDRWSYLVEGAYVSDPTFIQAFDLRDPAGERFGKDRREFINAVHLRRAQDHTHFSLEARARLQDFLVNEYLIQTPGYSVDKFPEGAYFRAADDVLRQQPGALTWTHEYRAGVMRLNFHEPTARQIGFGGAGRALAFWGIGPDQSPADVLRARGLHEDPVFRFDTRHELSAPRRAGPINITPFLVGRATLYDEAFDEFSPEMDEPYRLWGAAGVTLSTELVRVDDRISSRFFDLHRIRHIIKPSVTFWHAGSTIDRQHLPVYDADVEDLVEGSAVRFGLDQTWQTQRGGPGRWRSVDLFRLNAELVTASGDVERKSPLPRYFDFRPEYGNLGGTFGTVEGTWLLSEVVGLGGEAVYDFETDRIARTSIGLSVEHVPDFRFWADLRHLNPQDQTYASVGTAYHLTPKYTVVAHSAFDTDRGEFAWFFTQIERRFPNLVLGIGIAHNNISGDTSFSLVFQPLGVQAATARVRGLGAASPEARQIGIGQ